MIRSEITTKKKKIEMGTYALFYSKFLNAVINVYIFLHYRLETIRRGRQQLDYLHFQIYFYIIYIRLIY